VAVVTLPNSVQLSLSHTVVSEGQVVHFCSLICAWEPYQTTAREYYSWGSLLIRESCSWQGEAGVSTFCV
jgi:hypothetical protein